MSFEQLEETRIAYRNKIYLCCFIIIILIILSIILKLGDIFIPIFIVGIIVTGIVSYKVKNDYVKAYKDYFVKRGLQDVFDNLRYEPNMGMPENVIASTKMMYMGDDYSSNDFVSGTYKGINFSQADVDIEEEHQSTDSDGNTTTTYVTIFKGRWMIFDFNKPFKSNVQVAQKGFGNNRVKRKSIFSSKQTQGYYNRVKMESESFNKRFNTYAQSDHEAFYLLTPSLMEKIERLDDCNKGRILLCFVNNKLHIGLYDNKDSFEPPSCLFKIDEQKETNKTKEDILAITQFVDELSLDNNLFRKED